MKHRRRKGEIDWDAARDSIDHTETLRIQQEDRILRLELRVEELNKLVEELVSTMLEEEILQEVTPGWTKGIR